MEANLAEGKKNKYFVYTERSGTVVGEKKLHALESLNCGNFFYGDSVSGPA